MCKARHNPFFVDMGVRSLTAYCQGGSGKTELLGVLLGGPQRFIIDHVGLEMVPVRGEIRGDNVSAA
jgi:hypothetical protein